MSCPKGEHAFFRFSRESNRGCISLNIILPVSEVDP